jgi:hypothetical protein
VLKEDDQDDGKSVVEADGMFTCVVLRVTEKHK